MTTTPSGNEHAVIVSYPVMGQVVASRMIGPNEYEYAVDVAMENGITRATGLRRVEPQILGTSVDYDAHPEGTTVFGHVTNGYLYLQFRETPKQSLCGGGAVVTNPAILLPPPDGSPGAPGGGFSPPPGTPTGGGPGGGGGGGSGMGEGSGGSAPSEGGGGGVEAST